MRKPGCHATSVNFVRQFVPEIEQLDGELGMDVDVNGTIGRPVLSGAADFKVNVARFANATIPALRTFDAHLVFAGDTLSLQRFSGELAGGSFTGGGRITFPKLTQPTLDLQFRAKSALVARNDTLTMRADGDIRISGPLALGDRHRQRRTDRQSHSQEYRAYSYRFTRQASAATARRDSRIICDNAATSRLEI